jgi:NAD(P)-dependent dehydrogenase (short-subunit alcohol dehydrogenase family)
MAYSMDLSGRVALRDRRIQRPGRPVRAHPVGAPARRGAGQPPGRKAQGPAREIEGEGGDAHVVELDVTDHDSIKSAVAHAETEVGSIDILVNNSGVSTTQRLQDVAEGLRLHFQHQRQGRLFCGAGGRQAHAGARAGAAPGTFTGGRIINVASCRPEGGAPDWRVLHEQGGCHAHDQGHGAGVGPLRHQRERLCPGYIDTEINHHHWQTEQGQKLVRCCRASAWASPRTWMP